MVLLINYKISDLFFDVVIVKLIIYCTMYVDCRYNGGVNEAASRKIRVDGC